MHDDRTPDESVDHEAPRDEHPAGSHLDEKSDSTDVNAPFAPHENDDSPLGDTDQHSTA